MSTQTGENEDLNSLSFLTLGLTYLRLASNVFQETIKQGNNWMLVLDEPIIDESYDEATKWSDFNIIEPTLFDFYHGLELIMKGILFLSNNAVEAQHNFRESLNQIVLINDLQAPVKKILEEHIDISKMDSFISQFMKNNGQNNVNKLYETLRYPMDKDFRKFNDYLGLHHKEKALIQYLKKIRNDIDQLMHGVVKYYRSKTVNINN